MLDIKFEPLIDTLRLEKISDAIYFSEKYSDYISNSRLSKINPEQDGSIQIFLDGLQAHRIFNNSLTLGSAVHEMCLQKEYFNLADSIINKPTSKAGFIADECISMCKDVPSDDIIKKACVIVDYYKGNPSENQFNKLKGQIIPYIKSRLEYESRLESELEQIYLDPKQMETAKACIKAIDNNKKMQKLLHPEGIVEAPISENEQTILLDVRVQMPKLEPFIIRLKSKLDNYTIDKESNVITVNDIKTHGKILPEFKESLQRFHYMREMAMYSWLLSLCAKKFYNIENPIIKSNFLVVSTIPQYYTQVFPMTKKLFKQGFNEFKELLKLASVALYFKDEELTNKYINGEY